MNLALLIAAATAVGEMPHLTLTLRPAAVARESRVSLSDVATCAGSQTLCAEVDAVDLGVAPTPGQTATIELKTVRAILAREWPGEEITVTGAESTRLAAPSEPANERSVQEAFTAQLTELFGADDRLMVVVERVRLGSDARVSVIQCRYEFPDLAPALAHAPGFVMNRLVGTHPWSTRCVDPDNAPLQAPPPSFAAVATVSAKWSIPVAVRDLKPGDFVGADDLALAWVEVGRTRTGFPATERDQIVGKRLRHPVAAGKPFAASTLEVPLCVKRGQRVLFHAERAGIEVKGEAKVLANGAPGDIVEATSLATGKKIRVRVIDNSSVEYLF